MTKIVLLKAGILRNHLAVPELTALGMDGIIRELQEWHEQLPEPMKLRSLYRTDWPPLVRWSIYHLHLLYHGAFMLVYRRVAAHCVRLQLTGRDLASSAAQEPNLVSLVEPGRHLGPRHRPHRKPAPRRAGCLSPLLDRHLPSPHSLRHHPALGRPETAARFPPVLVGRGHGARPSVHRRARLLRRHRPRRPALPRPPLGHLRQPAVRRRRRQRRACSPANRCRRRPTTKTATAGAAPDRVPLHRAADHPAAGPVRPLPDPALRPLPAVERPGRAEHGGAQRAHGRRRRQLLLLHLLLRGGSTGGGGGRRCRPADEAADDAGQARVGL
ncbi:hypothetical protein VTG60DRAFT_2957 [Thermothelomyces hinnuleus]